MDVDLAKSIMWLGLAFLWVTAGGGVAYVLWRLGRMIMHTDGLVADAGAEVLPLIDKAGVSMDQVNNQLQKVDIVMDSAVDVAQSLDTSVRAVSFAITEPVRKVSGAMAGIGEAATSMRSRVQAGFDVARSADEHGDGTDTGTS